MNPNRERTPDPSDDAFELRTGDVDLHDLVTQYMQETVVARRQTSSASAASAREKTEVVAAPSDDPPSGLDETQPLTPVQLPPSEEDEAQVQQSPTHTDPAPRRGGAGIGDALFSGRANATHDDTRDKEATSPGLLPVPKTGANAAHEKRGEVTQLLASIGPFLWSLEGAERWVRAHGNGDAEAESYARALGLLARVLSQLQARMDEVKDKLR